jgi:hypothetical protein
VCENENLLNIQSQENINTTSQQLILNKQPHFKIPNYLVEISSGFFGVQEGKQQNSPIKHILKRRRKTLF